MNAGPIEEQRDEQPSCGFEYDDAAYVLNALDADERAAFEAHLATCDACTARVAELRGLPAQLASVPTAEALATRTETVPETLLPGLLRRAARERRRQRGLVVGLGSIAAAAVAALIVVTATGNSASNGGREPAAIAMHAVVASPVSATVQLTAKTWGTEIQVRCHYAITGAGESASYNLVVVDQHNVSHSLSSWTLQPGPDKTFPASTSLTRSQIKKVQIDYLNTPILSLDT